MKVKELFRYTPRKIQRSWPQWPQWMVRPCVYGVKDEKGRVIWMSGERREQGEKGCKERCSFVKVQGKRTTEQRRWGGREALTGKVDRFLKDFLFSWVKASKTCYPSPLTFKNLQIHKNTVWACKIWQASSRQPFSVGQVIYIHLTFFLYLTPIRWECFDGFLTNEFPAWFAANQPPFYQHFHLFWANIMKHP